MKKIAFMIIALVAMVMTACGSGASSYNAEKCSELIAKSKSTTPLTQDDYKILIEQYGALSRVITDKLVDAGFSKDQSQEDQLALIFQLMADKDFSPVMQQAAEIEYILGSADLDQANTDLLDKVAHEAQKYSIDKGIGNPEEEVAEAENIVIDEEPAPTIAE